MDQELSIKCGGIAFEASMLSRTIYVAPCHVQEALGAILEAMEAMADSSMLCRVLSYHPDFCELAARVSAVRMLRRKLAYQDLTDAEHAALNALRTDTCEWIRAEAGRALIELAEPLCDQDAAQDVPVFVDQAFEHGREMFGAKSKELNRVHV